MEDHHVQWVNPLFLLPFSIAMLNYQRVISGWWFGTWILLSIYWECHHPNWRTHIFQRGRYTTNQTNMNQVRVDELMSWWNHIDGTCFFGVESASWMPSGNQTWKGSPVSSFFLYSLFALTKWWYMFDCLVWWAFRVGYVFLPNSRFEVAASQKRGILSNSGQWWF